MRLITEDNIDQLMSLSQGGVTEIRSLTHDKKANYKSVKELTTSKQLKDNRELERKEFLKQPMAEESNVPQIISGWDVPSSDWNVPGQAIDTGMMMGGPMTAMTGMMSGFDDGDWTSEEQYNNPFASTVTSDQGWNQGVIDKTEQNPGPFQPTEAQKTPNMNDKVIFNGGEGHIFELPEWDEDPDNMLYGIRMDDGVEKFLPLQEIMDWSEDPDFKPYDSGSESDEDDYEEKPPLVIDKDDADIKKDIKLLNVEEIKEDEKEEEDNSDKKSVTMDTN